tara:strand:+ start:459 stop:638 length:180 start_codon:yes stop_codon:yes gene_type:complete
VTPLRASAAPTATTLRASLLSCRDALIAATMLGGGRRKTVTGSPAEAEVAAAIAPQHIA